MKGFKDLDSAQWADLLKNSDYAELADKLWHEYFDSDTSINATEKRLLMDRYNEVANLQNDKVEFKQLNLITPSTRWEPDADEEKDPQPTVMAPGTKVVPTIDNDGGIVSADIVKDKGKKKTTKPATKKKKEVVIEADAAPVPIAAGEDPNPPKPGSKIALILDLHKQGKSNKEIIALGHNKSTVNRQVAEYKNRIKNGK